MAVYRIGRIEGAWDNLIPPIRGGVYKRLSGVEEDPKAMVDAEKRAIDADVEDEGSNNGAGSDEETSVDIQIDQALPALTQLDALTVPIQSLRSCSPVLDSPFTPITNIINTEFAPKDRTQGILDAMQSEIDDNKARYPSVDADTQNEIDSKFKALHQRVHDEGFYTCRYSQYAKECTRYALLFTLFILTLRAQWYKTSAVFLGFFWQQIMFTAHDAGHLGITAKFIPDTLIGIFIADLCCGLSIGWWKSSHNVHHLVTNAPEHDPDIQNTPLFATCPSQFRSVRSTYYEFTFVWDKACEILLPYQKYAYYPIMAVARFNLYMLSWGHLLSRRSKPLGAAAWTRPAELVAMCGYWYLFGYVLVLRTLPTWFDRVAFVLISHCITMILHVQITLSHWAMPTSNLGETESFPQKQLRTTMDVSCPEWLDFFHGGLQFQAIHHLFPRVPRHNLRKLQGLVKDFCGETGIRYNIYGFGEGNELVLGRLEEISKQLETLGKCQKYMMETGESGLH
jgi:delta8-fatty-acid desaturase